MELHFEMRARGLALESQNLPYKTNQVQISKGHPEVNNETKMKSKSY